MGPCDRKRTLMGKLVHDPTQLLNSLKQAGPRDDKLKSRRASFVLQFISKMGLCGVCGKSRSHTHPSLQLPVGPFPHSTQQFPYLSSCPEPQYASAVLAWKVQFFHPIDENQITGSLAFSQPIPFSNCHINIVMAASKTEKHFNGCVSEQI